MMGQGLSNRDFVELSVIHDGIEGSTYNTIVEGRVISSKNIMMIATDIVLAMIGSYIACKNFYQHLLHFSQIIKSMSEIVTYDSFSS
jgi:hypothetical protein